MTRPVSELAPPVDAAGISAPRAGSILRALRMPLVQAVLIVTVLWVFLEGWHRDIRVPFGFVSDSVWYLAQSKSTIDNGWWWWNPRLGAPVGLDAVSYPSNSTVDQMLVWLVSRVVPDAFAAINVTWVLLVVLSGISATWCIRALGASKAGAFAAGTLFALTPYALYRHIDHFALVIYLVPFPCAAALWLAAGEPHASWGRTARLVIFGGCVLLGFNYIYYAFFASFCVLVGALIGYVSRRDTRVLASGLFCLALITSSTIVNLSPSFYSWYRHGSPLIEREKVPAEAETYGLKIRHLVSPVFPHRFPPFNRWVAQEAAVRFQNENENWTVRLGIVGTAGFLGLLVLLFLPDTRSRGVPLLQGASRLTLAALLLGTVGGFGVLFNLLVSSDIRAYNRVSPFITFFSLLAVVLTVDRLFKAPRARTVAVAVILLVGVADQGQATARINERYAGIASELKDMRTLVGTLERTLPASAMVFQLPVRAYMSESDFGRMKQYDQFKPYLVSSTLRFSYPAFSNEQVRWQRAMTGLDMPTLASRLAGQNFSAVLVDRYGYEDQGAAVIAGLKRAAGDDRVIVSTDRFFAVDIRAAGNSAAAAETTVEPVALTLSMMPCAPTPSLAAMVSVADQVDQIGDSRAPWGAGTAQIRRSQEAKVSGWAIDGPRRLPAAGVDVVIDRMVFPTTYGTHRNDVAEYFRLPSYRDTGFTATIPANAIPPGERWLSIRVVRADGRCYFQSSGFRVMSIE
jgi:phosphoglycerol transferase